MRHHNNNSGWNARRTFALGLAVLLLVAATLAAQVRPKKTDQETLVVDVDLVVLHTTVVDEKGHLVTNLPASSFRVYEDNIEQKLSVFRNEDVPVTAGLVLDNSASMRPNRHQMMAGALRFVETSNAMDEIFVVNFNDDYYLDLRDKDFSNDVKELKEALEKTNTRGSTAFYDALRASLQHLKRGTRQKKVLLVITDGVDNASISNFNTVLREAQQSEAGIYLVALPCEGNDKRDCRRAKREMRKLADTSGGLATFPTSIEQVDALCRQIAHDIRNQYVLGYYPLNKARDGSFRNVRVEIVKAPKGAGKLTVRHRMGYYAGPAPGGAGTP
ncbi:MAG TPA: VWA domain-containing protein [Candidatus Xenobia bacterium]|nr:VWA domain-containing protein [Candidatus Xenobia bacterium]